MTSANVITYKIYDLDGNHLKDIRHNLYCKFPIDKFEELKPRENFQFQIWRYDEDEVLHKSERKKLSESVILSRYDKKNKQF